MTPFEVIKISMIQDTIGPVCCSFVITSSLLLLLFHKERRLTDQPYTPRDPAFDVGHTVHMVSSDAKD